MAQSVNVPDGARERLKINLSQQQDAAHINRVLASPEVSLTDMQGLSSEEKAQFLAALEAERKIIGDDIHGQLSALLKEAGNASVAPTVAPAASIPVGTLPGGTDGKKEELKGVVPKEVSDAAGYARISVSKAFGDPGTDRYKGEYLGTIRAALGKIPGYEPSTQSDISDAIYQSRDFNIAFINWLEGEAAKDTSSLDTSIKGSGSFPFIFDKTTFSSVAEKRQVIVAMLKGLGEALAKPEVQAGVIESFLGEGLVKKAIIVGGGTVVAGVVVGVLLYKGGKWVLGRVLGAAGVAIAGAIGSLIGKGVNLGAKSVKAGATAAAGAVRNRGSAAPAAAPGAAPATGPTAVPTRELDMKRTIDRMVHENILKEIYRQGNGGIAGTPDQIKELGDAIKNAIASPAEITEYHNRVARYIELGDRPITDAKKMAEWDAKLERVIVGEQDPKKWQFKESKKVKAAAPAAAANLQTRLRQAAADAKPIEFRVGSDVYDIIPSAERPLRDLQILQDTIADNEAKLKELQDAQKKLEARLALENEYGKLTQRLTDIGTALPAQQTLVNNALATAEGHSARFKYPADPRNPSGRQLVDVDSLKLDPTYKTDKAIYDRENAKLESLMAEEKSIRETKLPSIDSQLRDLTGKTSSSLSRYGKSVFSFDTSGNLIDSLTKQKLDNPLSASYSPDTPGNSGVKAQISHLNSVIAQNYRDLDIKMSELHALNSKFPNAWRKAGLTIEGIKVSKVGLILESGIKLFKK